MLYQMSYLEVTRDPYYLVFFFKERRAIDNIEHLDSFVNRSIRKKSKLLNSQFPVTINLLHGLQEDLSRIMANI